MAVATTNILTDVGDAIKSFRTENGAEFTNYMLATSCRNKTIRREHAGVNGPKLNGVVEGGQTRSDQGRRHSRLPWAPPTITNFHDPDRFWVETAIYMTGCLNTTATVANAGCNSPCEAWFGRLTQVNTLAFMQLRFLRVKRADKSELKAERCYNPSRRRSHPRDSVKVLISAGLTIYTRDVTWLMERVATIATEPDTGMAVAPKAWEADWHVRYLPPVSQVPPVLPVIPVMGTVPSVMRPATKPGHRRG